MSEKTHKKKVQSSSHTVTLLQLELWCEEICVFTLISDKVTLPNLVGMCKSRTFKIKFPDLDSYINFSLTIL
jgi:hypothetical protein